MTPFIDTFGSAVPKRTLLDNHGVVGNKYSLRFSMLGLCGTCTLTHQILLLHLQQKMARLNLANDTSGTCQRWSLLGCLQGACWSTESTTSRWERIVARCCGHRSDYVDNRGKTSAAK